MQGGEERGRASVAKDLTGIALTAFGKFFVQALFAFFECARERGGRDEESQQEDRPRQTAQPEDGRADEGRRVRAALAQAVKAVGGISDDDCEYESDE